MDLGDNVEVEGFVVSRVWLVHMKNKQTKLIQNGANHNVELCTQAAANYPGVDLEHGKTVVHNNLVFEIW